MNSVLASIFEGKTVSLLGAGISNMPLAKVAAPLCRKLTVRDRKSPAELGEAAETLLSLGAELITGEDYLEGITEDLVFRSPGIRPDLPPLKAAAERGCVLTSEMELFLSLGRCPVYAVTGSDGKTTTTTITSLLLQPKGKVFVGGNIGEPLLYRCGDIGPEDALAVELSSFQLMTVDAPVEAAAITNITPNHLNWHVDMDEYTTAKKRILTHAGRAVLNYDNDATRKIAGEMRQIGKPVTFFSLAPLPEGTLGEKDSAVWYDPAKETIFSYFPEEGRIAVLNRKDVKLPGLHNLANYMTAISLTHGCTSLERIREVASTFGGVEHRLEFVREKDGVTFINGSIDSSPTRTAAALSALKDRPVVLIAGGSDKHISYDPLADAVFDSTVRAVVLTGETMEKIFASLTAHPACADRVKNGFVIVKNPDFDEAVREAAALARTGDTVILSPASASFDHFKNFEMRGRHFKDLVRAL